MSSNRSGRRSLPRVRIKPRTRDGDVGYRRPPRNHQFKPGQSGNPRGRPKGARNESSILREIFERKIESRSGGRSRKITILDVAAGHFKTTYTSAIRHPRRH